MEALNLIGLESNERDFRKATKLLTNMLEPASGKVKFRVFGYVRFGFKTTPQHQIQTTEWGGGGGPGTVRLGECILGWTNLIKEKDELHLTFIDLKNEDMQPSFSAVVNEDATLEIVTPREVAFHFKKTTVQVLMSLDVEMDRVTDLIFSHSKKCFHKSVRSSKTTSPRFVSRPVLIRSITDSPDPDSLEDKVLRSRPSTPVIPRQWRRKTTLDKRNSVSLENLATPGPRKGTTL